MTKANKDTVISDLTTGRRSDKRYIGTLERDAARLKLANTRLEAELEACRRECGLLKNNEVKRDLQLSDLKLQVYNFQKLIYYNGQVTTWVSNDE